MKTTATVIEVNGKTATVETVRTAACEGCHKMADGGECSVCSLMGSNRKLRAKADNSFGARPGDRVEVETATSRVLLYSALVFLLPVLVAALGWWIASLLTDSMPLMGLGALIGFGLSFVILRVISGVLQKKQCDVVITGIISPARESSDPSVE